jgi:predicted PurR-regulated permease PerM
MTPSSRGAVPGAPRGDEPRWFRRLDRWAAVGWRFIVVVAAIGLAVWLITHLRLILLPAIFAVFICTALVPVRDLFERARVPRALSALLAMLAGLLAVALLLLLIIPPIISEWDEIADAVGTAYDDIFDWLEDGPFGLTDEQGRDLRRNVEAAQDTLLEGIARGAVSGLPVVIEAGAGILLAVVITFFVLRDGERLWQWSVRLLPVPEHVRTQRAGRRVWDTLTRYLRGVTVVAAVDAVGIGLGAFIIGVPLAIPIAVLTFLTAFVPIIGAVVAGLVAVLIAFANGGLADALWMLGVVLVVQQLESNVIAPALIGRSVQIHPLVILLGVVAGAGIAGVLGAILVTPLIAVAVTLLHEFFGDHPVAGEEGTPPGEGTPASIGEPVPP